MLLLLYLFQLLFCKLLTCYTPLLKHQLKDTLNEIPQHTPNKTPKTILSYNMKPSPFSNYEILLLTELGLSFDQMLEPTKVVIPTLRLILTNYKKFKKEQKFNPVRAKI